MTINLLQNRAYDLSDEVKSVRHVRTQAGVRRFNQPIGSIIVRDRKLRHLTSLEPEYDGWDRAKGSDGKTYSVGQDDDGKWIATIGDSWDAVVTARSEDEVWDALDSHAGGGKGKPTPAGTPTGNHRSNFVQKHINSLGPRQRAQYDALSADDKKEYESLAGGGGTHKQIMAGVESARKYRAKKGNEVTDADRRAVGGLDTMVRDWYFESRDAGADHQTALRAAKEFDKVSEDFSKKDWSDFNKVLKKHNGNYAKALEEWKGDKSASGEVDINSLQKSGMPTAANVKPGDIVAPTWAADNPARVEKVGKITPSGRVTIYYEGGARQTYKIGERLHQFKPKGRKALIERALELKGSDVTKRRRRKPGKRGTGYGSTPGTKPESKAGDIRDIYTHKPTRPKPRPSSVRRRRKRGGGYGSTPGTKPGR